MPSACLWSDCVVGQKDKFSHTGPVGSVKGSKPHSGLCSLVPAWLLLLHLLTHPTHGILRRYQWQQWHLQLLSQAHFLPKTSPETRMLLLKLMQWLTRTWGWMPKGGPLWRKMRRVAIETGWTGSTQQHCYMFLSTWFISTPVSADSSWSWVAPFWCICKCVVLIFAVQKGFTEVLLCCAQLPGGWASWDPRTWKGQTTPLCPGIIQYLEKRWLSLCLD